MALTDKQKAFVTAYISNGFNATQAAIEAGYSEKTARAIGCENLTKPDIRQAVDEFLNTYAMSAIEVLGRLADHARGDMRDFAKLSLDTLDKHPRGNLIKKIKVGVELDKNNKLHQYIESFELYDAQAALIQLGRYHKLFTDKQELTGENGNAIPILITGMDMNEL